MRVLQSIVCWFFRFCGLLCHPCATRWSCLAKMGIYPPRLNLAIFVKEFFAYCLHVFWRLTFHLPRCFVIPRFVWVRKACLSASTRQSGSTERSRRGSMPSWATSGLRRCNPPGPRPPSMHPAFGHLAMALHECGIPIAKESESIARIGWHTVSSSYGCRAGISVYPDQWNRAAGIGRRTSLGWVSDAHGFCTRHSMCQWSYVRPSTSKVSFLTDVSDRWLNDTGSEHSCLHCKDRFPFDC